MRNKKILNKEKCHELDVFFKKQGVEARMNFVYAVSLLQCIFYIVLRKKQIFKSETLERYLVNEYLPLQLKTEKPSMYFLDICKQYIKTKHPLLNFDNAINLVLISGNSILKDEDKFFKNINDYLEYLVSFNVTDKDYQKICSFLYGKKK